MSSDKFVPDYMLDPPSPMQYPPCPVCGSDLYEFVYKDIDGEVCGCDMCVKSMDANEYADEMAEMMREEADEMTFRSAEVLRYG